MAVVIITSRNTADETELLEQCYRLRHRIFVEECGWQLPATPDGREIDPFDTPEAVHLAVVEDGRPVAYSRLLPTMRPHLLSEVYPELLGGAPLPRASWIYEWTRFCVARERRDGVSAMSRPGQLIFVAVAELCLAAGIHAVTLQSDPIWLTRFLELGWRTRPLALPQTYAGQLVVPLIADVTEQTLEEMRQVFDIDRPLLSADAMRPAELVTELIASEGAL